MTELEWKNREFLWLPREDSNKVGITQITCLTAVTFGSQIFGEPFKGTAGYHTTKNHRIIFGSFRVLGINGCIPAKLHQISVGKFLQSQFKLTVTDLYHSIEIDDNNTKLSINVDKLTKFFVHQRSKPRNAFESLFDSLGFSTRDIHNKLDEVYDEYQQHLLQNKSEEPKTKSIKRHSRRKKKKSKEFTKDLKKPKKKGKQHEISVIIDGEDMDLLNHLDLKRNIPVNKEALNLILAESDSEEITTKSEIKPVYEGSKWRKKDLIFTFTVTKDGRLDNTQISEDSPSNFMELNLGTSTFQEWDRDIDIDADMSME